jgi:hypothetical protein
MKLTPAAKNLRERAALATKQNALNKAQLLENLALTQEKRAAKTDK